MSAVFRSLFEEFDPTDTFARLKNFWNLQAPLPVPWSLDDFPCPICRDSEAVLRQWRFHEQPRSTARYRCDVSFKCRWCAMVWVHGVAVPEAVWHRHAKKVYNRHDAQRLFANQGEGKVDGNE